ncbi:hypothetical protein JCM9533A_15250 [Catenuloplanes niger JCM 9533]
MSPSPAGLRALRVATAEARRRGMPLHAVHAWESGSYGSAYLVGRREARRVVTDCFEATMGGLPDGVTVEVLTVVDRPARALTGYTRDEDVLVVGRPDRPWWWRLFHRSVADRCVAHARCPLLVVPPDALAREAARRGATRLLLRELADLTGA